MGKDRQLESFMGTFSRAICMSVILCATVRLEWECAAAFVRGYWEIEEMILFICSDWSDMKSARDAEGYRMEWKHSTWS